MTSSSFYTDGETYDTAVVTSNDKPASTTPSQAPSSFYPSGNVYDYLSQESDVVALLQQLVAQTNTNAAAAASSVTQAATYATQSATSASQAETSAEDAASAVSAALAPLVGTATPLIDGTAAVGTSTKWAHEDHVHPKDPTLASVSYVDTKVAAVVNSAPSTLDTLNELATALGDDPNFATTVSTQIGTKADKTYVDTQDAAGKTYTDNSVAPKADKTYVDTQDAKAVLFASAQSLTAPQQAQARANIASGIVPVISTATLGATITMNTNADFTAASVSQGSSGVFLAIGCLAMSDASGAFSGTVKLTDGTTTYAVNVGASAANIFINATPVFVFTNPVGNITLKASDSNGSPNGRLLSGSSLTVIRLA